MMASSGRTIGFTVLVAAAVTVVLIAFIIPGCTQMQDNSPINVRNSPGDAALSVTCSTDGSVAYVTDGRNVYRYAMQSGAEDASWQCILSQTQRLELANQHDPRETLPATQ